MTPAQTLTVGGGGDGSAAIRVTATDPGGPERHRPRRLERIAVTGTITALESRSVIAEKHWSRLAQKERFRTMHFRRRPHTSVGTTRHHTGSSRESGRHDSTARPIGGEGRSMMRRARN